jgi:pimeloyl-ACP methyl ester carboxylesterase
MRRTHAPRQFSFIDLDGTRIHYDLHRAEGSASHAPTLVGVHGFGGNLHTWNDILPLLAPRCNFLRLDLRGFGYSDKPDDWRYDVAEHGRIVARLVERLELGRVVPLGHSFGAAVAVVAACALADTGRLLGVVVMDGAGFPLRFPFQLLVYRIPVARWIASLTSPEWRIEFTLRRLYHTWTAITPERIQRYSHFLDLPGSEQAFTRVARAIDVNDSSMIVDALARLTVPALVIWGENDRIIPPSHAAHFATHLVRGTVRLIPLCGHAPQEEHPRQTATEILSFLGGLE